jgi:hypothetical protein
VASDSHPASGSNVTCGLQAISGRRFFGTQKYEHLYLGEIPDGDALAVKTNLFRQTNNTIWLDHALADRTPRRAYLDPTDTRAMYQGTLLSGRRAIARARVAGGVCGRAGRAQRTVEHPARDAKTSCRTHADRRTRPRRRPVVGPAGRLPTSVGNGAEAVEPSRPAAEAVGNLCTGFRSASVRATRDRVLACGVVVLVVEAEIVDERCGQLAQVRHRQSSRPLLGLAFDPAEQLLDPVVGGSEPGQCRRSMPRSVANQAG